MTTTPTAWAHLPNAAHIDRILAHVKSHPDRWGAAWVAAEDAVRGAVRVAARYAAWDAAWVAARDVARVAARDAARNAALDALYALIAWDDCAYLLDLHPDALAILIHTAPEPLNRQATLLLPAAVALQK